MGVSYNPRVVTDNLVFCIDTVNPKSFSPNVFSGSLDLYSWFSARSTPTNACTISQDPSTGLSPAGGIPLKMSVTGNDPHIGSYAGSAWNICPAANNQTWTVSTYVKGSVNTTGELFIFGATAAGALAGAGGLAYNSGAIDITTEWTRVEYTFTFNSANVAYIQTRFDGPNSGGSGQTIWWDGMQLELSPSSTRFNPTVNTNRSNLINLVGLGNNATLINTPTFNNGGFFEFTGANQFITLSSSLGLRNIPTYTLDCWVYVSSYGAARYTMYVETVPASTSRSSVLLSIETTGQARLAGRDSAGEAGSLVEYVFSASQVPLNAWTNIVAVYDSTTDVHKMYINGKLDNTASVAATSMGTGTSSVLKINGTSGGTELMTGNLCIFKTYSVALSNTQIEQNFNALRRRFGV